MDAKTLAEALRILMSQRGRAKSPRKTAACRLNGRLGGRPARAVQQIGLNGPGGIFASAKQAGEVCGVSASAIRMVLNGKRDTAGGYGWRWV